MILLILAIALTLIVVAFFLLAVGDLRGTRAAYEKELVALDAVDEIETHFPIPGGERRGLQKELLDTTKKSMVVAERVDLFSQAMQVGSMPGYDMLADLAEERLEGFLQRPKTIANSLILVGLAGTLGGLSVAVYGLNRHLAGSSENQTAEFLAAIRQTLGGLQLAFWPSLAAVVCTCILLCCIHLFQKTQRSILCRLERCTPQVLVRLFSTEADVVEESLSATVRALQTMSGAASSSANELQAAMDEIKTELLDAANQIPSRLKRSAKLQVALEESIKRVEVPTSRLAILLQQVEDATRQLTAGLEKAHPLVEQLKRSNDLVAMAISPSPVPASAGAANGAVMEVCTLLVETLVTTNKEIQALSDKLRVDYEHRLSEQEQRISKLVGPFFHLRMYGFPFRSDASNGALGHSVLEEPAMRVLVEELGTMLSSVLEKSNREFLDRLTATAAAPVPGQAVRDAGDGEWDGAGGGRE